MRVLPAVIDLFWPSLRSWSQKEYKHEAKKRNKLFVKGLEIIEAMGNRTTVELEQGVLECKALFEAEQKRRESIESRLSSVTGMTSVAAAVTFGIIALQYRNEIIDMKAPLVNITRIIVLYGLTQLVCALIAEIRGLSRRSYLMPSIKNVLPLRGESVLSLAIKRMTAYLRCAYDHREQNSGKLNQLAVAHRAIVNFLGSILVVMILLSVIAFYQGAEAINRFQSTIRPAPAAVQTEHQGEFQHLRKGEDRRLEQKRNEDSEAQPFLQMPSKTITTTPASKHPRD